MEIPYQPQPYQAEIENDTTRFKVVIIGRRGGKTEMAINIILDKAMSNPGLYWILAPYYGQVKDIVWIRLKTLLKNDPYWKYNEVELSAYHTLRQTRIVLKGADKPDSLRGIGLKGVILDECRDIRETAWTSVVRPMLIDSNGWAMFISTPKGRNWLYDLYIKGLDEKELEWKGWHFPTNINKYIPAEEIKQTKQDMSERLFRQEIMAEFLDDETSVFKGVRKCAIATLKSPIEGRFYVMGVDLAKSHDFTVLNVIDALTREVVAFDRFQDIRWPEQKGRIQFLANKYNNALVWLDATGVGDPIFDDLQVSGVSIEGFKFTNESKQQLVEQLAIAIEQRLITFPNINVITQELMQFEYSITKGGKIVYSAPEGKHDDCVISLGLAVWGIKNYLQSAQAIERRIDEQEPIDKVSQGEPVEVGTGGYKISGY